MTDTSIFENAIFIESPGEFHPEYRSEEPAPLFRRWFLVRESLQRATLAVCGLGYGCYYINGEPVTQDRFIAPTSDYNKTLWYTTYDLTERLHPGPNLLAAILGNGFYNETLETAWGNNKALWRGLPKLLLSLRLTYADGTEYVVSDTEWRCSTEASPVRFNQLRNGEYYDGRLSENWCRPEYDDSAFAEARPSAQIPSGILRECRCQPIREFQHYPVRSITRNAAGNWVLDFGQNMSGYVRLHLHLPAGDTVTVRYTERLKPDGTRELNGMDSTIFYRSGEFQTDRVTCGEQPLDWSPRFVYHGFRYVELEGLRTKPDFTVAEAIFVHQAVDELSTFDCSEPILNQLYKMAKISDLSNLFYMPTDCPTREKMGWTNDAQASAEQMLQNFDTADLFEKWLQDIFDAMRDDGALPGIIPTHGWGYEWGSGPISSGVLFEVPYQLYRYADRIEPLRRAYQYFLRHLVFIRSKRDDTDGLIGYGLCDWAGPFPSMNHAPTPVKLTDTLLAIKFHRITAFAARTLGEEEALPELEQEEAALVTAFRHTYYDAESGRCRIEEQTAVAMMIVLGIYDRLEPLKEQLHTLIVQRDYHHHCGMLGLQYLYPALDICGLQEDALHILLAKGQPSYREWIDGGGTTLWEKWNAGDSNNHHMHACFLSFFMKTLVGLRLDESVNGFRRAQIQPEFVSSLQHCFGRYKTVAGVYEISWERRDDDTVRLWMEVPPGAEASLQLTGWRPEKPLPPKLIAGRYDLICIPEERQ